MSRNPQACIPSHESKSGLCYGVYYLWMTLGLLITAVSLHSPLPIMHRTFCKMFSLSGAYSIAQLLLVIVLAAAIWRLSFGAAALIFVLYAGLTGISSFRHCPVLRPRYAHTGILVSRGLVCRHEHRRTDNQSRPEQVRHIPDHWPFRHHSLP